MATTRSGHGISSMAMERQVDILYATIASGQSLSDTIALHGGVIVAIIMPASWTAADLSFAAWDGLNEVAVPVYDDTGVEVTVTAAASQAIVNAGSLEKLASLHDFAVRSGTASSPVAQGGDRVITLLVKG